LISRRSSRRKQRRKETTIPLSPRRDLENQLIDAMRGNGPAGLQSRSWLRADASPSSWPWRANRQRKTMLWDATTEKVVGRENCSPFSSPYASAHSLQTTSSPMQNAARAALAVRRKTHEAG
jgi:hypothetical protein